MEKERAITAAEEGEYDAWLASSQRLARFWAEVEAEEAHEAEMAEWEMRQWAA